MVFDHGRDRRSQYFGGGDIQQKKKVQIFDLAKRGETPHPQLLPLVGHPNLPIRKTLRRMLGQLTVISLTRLSENISFQSNNLQHLRLKMKKR